MASTLQVIDMIDAIGADSNVIPKGTRRVAAYLTGSGGIAWTAAQIANLKNKGVQLVLRIDQTNRLLSIPGLLVKDIEPGASTNSTAVQEASERARAGLHTVLYCMLSDFQTLKNTVAAANLASHVFYWVADWNLDRNGAIGFLEQHPDVVAVQWASPSSNPNTLMPGSKLTLRQANVDLSVTRADWPAPLPKPKPRPIPLPPKPHVKITAAGISGVLAAALLGYLNSHGAHVTHLDSTETSAISLVSALLAGYLVPVKRH